MISQFQEKDSPPKMSLRVMDTRKEFIKATNRQQGVMDFAVLTLCLSMFLRSITIDLCYFIVSKHNLYQGFQSSNCRLCLWLICFLRGSLVLE